MNSTPPGLAGWIIAMHLPARDRDEVLGDLEERFARRADMWGSRAARRWYWREALLFSWHVGRHGVSAGATEVRRTMQMSSLGLVASTLVQDVRYGIRLLASRPAFTGVAVLVLSLGIGANSAIFTLMNEMLLRPSAADRVPGRIVGLYSKDRVQPDRFRTFSYPNYIDVREGNDVFSGLTAQGIAFAGVTEGDTTRRAMTMAVSSNFFETLGAHLALGRAFSLEEERPGHAEAVAIVSHTYWKKHGASPTVLEDLVRINGRDHTIVGVTPRGFTGSTALLSPDVYVPLSAYERIANDFMQDEDGHTRLDDRENHSLLLVGRLRPGLTEALANPRLETLGQRMEEAHPVANKDQTLLAHALPRLSITTSPGDDNEVFALFGLLQAMSAVVLLIACLNLANMMLAHANARRREIGIRVALGAGRLRIVRQLLIEGFLLSLAGAAAGLLLAFWVTRAMADSMTGVVPVTIEYAGRPDHRVVIATIGFAMASTLLFALWPAWRLSKTNIVDDLKQRVGEGPGGRRRWLTTRHVLVVSQLALSLVLLTTGGLFVRSAADAAVADPGFEFRDGIVASLDPSLAGYDETRSRAAYRELLAQLRALPGVRAASIASTISFGDFTDTDTVQRADIDHEEARTDAIANVVGSDYFASLGLAMLRGREFTPAEEEASAGSPVVIIDGPLAQQLFPDVDPLGQQLVFLDEDDLPSGVPAQIVGVAPGLRHNLYDREPVAHVYRPFGQRHRSSMTLHVKTAGGTPDKLLGELLGSVRETIRTVDDRVPVLWLKTLENYRDTSLVLWLARGGARVFSVFGALALFLAVVGIYGVKAYLVALRTREIGVRIALGATSRNVLWMLIGESLALTGLGVAIGLGLATLVATGVAGLIYGTSPYDPIVFGGAVGVLALAALAATYFPARRAARTEPFTALRTD